MQQGEGAKTPIIILTARKLDPSAEAELRMEPNVVEFLGKPIKPPKLYVALQKALGGESDSPPPEPEKKHPWG